MTSLLLDGKCQNLVNIWRKERVNAGDDMILKFKRVMMPAGRYALSRQSNSENIQNFCDSDEDVKERMRRGIWQLHPHVRNMGDRPSESDGLYDYR